MLDKTLIRYFLVGCVSTLTHYVVSAGLYFYFNMSVVLATIIGFGSSWVVAYHCNYHFTFKANSDHKKSMFSYLVVTLIGFLLNISIMYVGVEQYSIDYTVTFFFMSILVFMNNYFLSKAWVFK